MTGELAGLHWMRPEWLLALLPAAVLFGWHWFRAQRQSGWEQLVEPELLEHLLERSPQSAQLRSRWPLLAAAFATFCAIIAMAGPAFEKTPQPPRQYSDTMLVVADLTLSMYAQDVQPSRLVRMRYKLLELLSRRQEGQTALLAYSGDAYVVSPLTDDASTIAAMVPALSPDIMPKIGSNAASAFQLASQLLNGQPASTVVWLTDDLSPQDERALQELLALSGAQLFIIGIGTQSGGPIPMPSGKFLKDARGSVATAGLAASELGRLASRLGGRYLAMRGDNSDVEMIISASGSATETRASSTDSSLVFDSWRDRGGTLCLFLLPFALFAFRRGWLLVLAFTALLSPQALLSTLAAPVYASPTNAASGAATNPVNRLFKRDDQRAAELLQSGDAQAAARLFARDDWRGYAAYQAGEYDTAAAAFRKQLQYPGSNNYQRADAHYNLGHSLARSGKLQEALQAYDSALGERPDFKNAQRARELVEQLLQQQQQDGQAGDGTPQDEDGEEGGSQGGSQASQQAEQQGAGGGQQSQGSDSASNANTDSGNDSGASTARDDQANDAAQGQDDRSSRDADLQPGSAANDAAGNEDTAAGEQAAATNPGQSQDGAAGQQASATSRVADEAEAGSRGEDASQQTLQATHGEGGEESLQQARLQQWLNKIEDDPGGLLRRKFQYQRQMRERDGDVVEPSEDGKIW